MQSEDYTSYMEKRFAKGMCITLKNEGIWTIEEDCSKSNSKEKEKLNWDLVMRNLFMTEMMIEFTYSDADMYQVDFRWRS